MKKELIYYSILTLGIALLLFFETNLFRDNTDLVSKVVDTVAFDKLDIDLDCNIYVSLGDEQKVVFEGPAKYLDRVETRMENGVLKVFCRKPGLLAELLNTDDEKQGPVNVYVKLTHADQLIMPKNGNLITNESLLLFDANNRKVVSYYFDDGVHAKGLAQVLKMAVVNMKIINYWIHYS